LEGASLTSLRPTFVTPRREQYLAAGGAWDRPTLDALLTERATSAVRDTVARVAGGLRAAGVRAGDAVAWQSPNRDEVALAYRACWRLGAVAAPVHHQAGANETDRCLQTLSPRVVLDLDALPDGSPVREPWVDTEQLAAVLWTSGSSGLPKGVLHTQATLAYKAATMGAAHGLTADDCVLMPAPCAHISGLLNGITLPGAVPFRSVFMARWDPDVALDLIEHEQVTFMVGPPTFFRGLMDAEAFRPERTRSLRLISSGGAAVSPAFVADAQEVLGARVKRTYGSTEAPTVITEGRAIGEVELTIAPDGELLVRGPEVCVGYLDARDNDDAFTEDGWFRTGDLVTVDAGTYEFTGRTKDVVIRGGENIGTAEVEGVLEQHPAVHQAVVVGYPDDLMGERVAAFVVGDSAFDVATAAAWFAERGVARFKTPERVFVVATIPTLGSGKPDRDALRRSIVPR
jgi:cyclohexanecarboxylate-CoA ligase